MSYSPDHVWEHGKVATYKHKPCRCEPCTAANTLSMNHYRRGKRQRVLVRGDRARQHIRWLCAPVPGKPLTGPHSADSRWTYRSLAKHIGMNPRGFGRFMSGEHKRISRWFADRILATPDRQFFLTLEKDPARSA